MSKREQVAEQATKSVEVTAQQFQFQNIFHRSLDETKENVRKSIDETRSQIPRYTTAVKNYQEQALESTGKMGEEYVEAQKSVMDSAFSSAAVYHENATRMFNYWYSSKVTAELWARSVSNIAENVSAAIRITNDILYRNIGAFGSAQQHMEELSRINVNNAKTVANTTKETEAEFSETFTTHNYKLC